jgi:Flp pilus assembly protein TadD
MLTGLLVAYAAITLRLPAGGGSKFDPLDPRPHRVESLIVGQRFSEALPLALELRRNFPTEPEVAYWVAIIQRGLGAAPAEAAAWEDYVRLSPEPLDACPAWPAAVERADRGDRALEIYERCAALDVRDPARLHDLADAYARAGRRDAATDAYRRAAALDPDDPAVQEHAGMIAGAAQ